jgi:hypothetical protein
LNRRHALQNKDKKKEYYRRYNVDKLAAETIDPNLHSMDFLRKDSHRRYYLQHKDKIRESNRRYRLENHENPELYYQRTLSASKSWKSPGLVREYFDSIAELLHISNFTDWYRISSDQIKLHVDGVISLIISFFFLSFL